MTTIKERVLQISDYYNIKKTKFFLDLDLAYANFKGESKNTSLGSDAIDKILSNFPEISVEWLVLGKGQMTKRTEFLENIEGVNPIHIEQPVQNFQLLTDRVEHNQQIPLYDIQAAAGMVNLFRDTTVQTPIDHISIPNLPKCDGAVYVSGDSMYPLLKSGDIIMYKKLATSIDNIFWGEMYLVSLTNDDGDEFVMVKWVHKSDQGEDYIRLVSENRHHQPKDFHMKNVKGLALIKASVRINSMY
ncbi:S24 family peptidase [Flavobacterium johnsoniae]|uniref:Peptidase S24-like n=1 Tax=Flavobacterium johnsoniae TaxID=986 RepID=A0A1M5VGG6_FLAJO|nr:S24 family peptidase [Flavobacterium johnsoniae]SHH74339.1 Peptidase S24-like [Flavobacterium johnsoniae]